MDVGGVGSQIRVEDFPQQPLFTTSKWITEGYFETMQNPVLAGRPIEWSDIHARAPVAVVTANFAEERWGSSAAALGKRIRHSRTTERRVDYDSGTPIWREIIGVVGNVRDDGVSQPIPTVVFWPMAQNRPPGLFPGALNQRRDGLFVRREMSFAVRTSRPSAASVRPEVGEAVRAISLDLALANVRTLDDILAQSDDMARTSFILVMLAIAAAVALGADRRDVRRMVVRQGVILAGIGVVIGLVAAVGLTRFMSSLLYGVEATDPMTFAAVAIMLTAIALVASYLPAVRASRTDPLLALRCE